jgi:putative two-component system response regulator
VALLDSCSQVQPDLVLINSSLAEICGPDIDGRLKADPRNKLTPVILITGPPNTSSTSPPPIIGTDSVWGGSPSRWEVLNRLHSVLHIKSYIDEQAVSVITSLARSIEGRDPYAKGHGERTAALAVQLGVRLDMSEVELEVLRMAALIHDIGKLMLPDSILLKPGWLTLEERKLMEQHPIEGERICSPLKVPS